MTKEEIIDGLEIYTVGRLNKARVHITVEELQKFIDAIKALEQEPRKWRWIEHPHEWGDNWQYSQYECSCCHNWAYHDTDYCPNCGAKMGEEE